MNAELAIRSLIAKCLFSRSYTNVDNAIRLLDFYLSYTRMSQPDLALRTVKRAQMRKTSPDLNSHSEFCLVINEAQ